jgi:NitT/TauT family transport system permease protein
MSNPRLRDGLHFSPVKSFRKLNVHWRLPHLRPARREIRHKHHRLWYIFAGILVLVFLTIIVAIGLSPRVGAVIIPSLLDAIKVIQTHPEAYSLPYYAARSILRLTVAYFVSFGLALSLSLIATHSKTLEHILVPIFDIMQSIPALAFFPIIVIYFIGIFHGSSLGLELASIALTMTGMLWYLTFNIIGAILTIPKDIKEAAQVFGLRKLQYIRHILLPAIYPGLVSGSIQAWGGGWNALIVSEYVIYAGHVYKVPGLGSFLAIAAWEYGSTTLVVVTLITMSLTIIMLNLFIWHRLYERMGKYRFA